MLQSIESQELDMNEQLNNNDETGQNCVFHKIIQVWVVHY